MTQIVNDDKFESEVIKSEMPVLVDFWAEWCGPCRMLAPILDQLSEKLKEKVKIVKINIDDNPETTNRLGIKGIPAMLLFKKGIQVAMKVGFHSQSAIQDWIESQL